jgi:hypothetical protein
MNRLVAILAVVALGVPSLASAFPGLTKAKSDLLHQTKKFKKFDGQCTDFSGSWKGTCDDGSGNATPDSMVIEQFGCDTLSFDNDSQSYDIGGSDAQLDTSTSSTDNTTVSLDWNADKTVANLSMGGAGRILGQAVSWELHGNGSMSLSGNTLTSTMGYQTSVNANGSTNLGGGTQYCFYTKQQ